MYLKTRTWMLISLTLLVASLLCWIYGNHYQAKKNGKPNNSTLSDPSTGNVSRSSARGVAPLFPLLTRLDESAPHLSGEQSTDPNTRTVDSASSREDALPFRVRNTSKRLNELVRSDSAVLLRNAFIDTAESIDLSIPEHLRSGDEPGSYIVQARGALNEELRAQLRAVQASIVSYIPNNAYLVQMSGRSARQLAGQPGIRALLPYEPYYKLDAPLLGLAVEQKPVPEDMLLRLTLFPGETTQAEAQLDALGALRLAEEQSPFGPQIVIKPRPDSLPELARLNIVQGIEIVRQRAMANDRARVRVGVSTNGTTTENYLGLTGRDMVVNINDTGVDATHPDFTGRLFAADPALLSDAIGHGTHVAGIIAGSGSQSGTVVSTPRGSETNASFRGMAPDAKLFVLATEYSPTVTVPVTDAYLYETAARTNSTMFRRGNATLISNNSWFYSGATDYDSAAARYDAAVRDALADKSGSQPVLFVFTSSNSGDGTDDGLNGNPNTIPSPGSAKNVITVGASENFRSVTNIVVITNSDPALSVTNTPFLPQSDSEDQVAPFSGRGNVGIGTEGQFGRFKPDVVAPGGFILSARSKDWRLENLVDFEEPDTRVVEALNAEAGPFYRYESGTSMAAPVVSGLLALMQEFFERKLPINLRRTNSPALMKALLINGARSLGNSYDLQVENSINLQGWGIVNLTNSLPSLLATESESRWPIRFFDQNSENAVATGQTKSWDVNLSTNAQQLGFRVTLVWTDPPGNPNAGIKLVNDLDLVVSNTVTHEVFYGNDIPQFTDFNQVRLTNSPSVTDVINNVENVFVRDAMGSNFVVSVIGKRVNVRALTAFNEAAALVNDVVQDFALVMSIGDLTLTNELSVTPFTDNATIELPPSIVMTNGLPLLNQRAGAQPPLLDARYGVANQWNFFVFTNTFLTNSFTTLTNGTNVAFITFLPPNLSKSRNLESDIDLYVSRDPRLRDLDPTVLDSAWKSIGRGGTELVVFTNAALDEIFHIGVRAEDQQGGEYGLIGISSDSPFERNVDGNPVLQGFPVGALIPDGSASSPGSVQVFAIGLTPNTVQRVIVTNLITHSNLGDLIGILSHNQESVVLNNHTLGNFTGTNFFVYDDSGFGRSFGSQFTDGPGSLENFVGSQSSGVWMLNMVDNSLSHTGRVENFSLVIKPFNQGDLGLAGPGGIAGSVGPNDSVCFFDNVPPEATNLIVRISQLTGPLDVFVRREATPTPEAFDKMARINPPGGDLTLGLEDQPLPLLAGRYSICLFNTNKFSVVDFRVAALHGLGPAVDSSLSVAGTNLVPVLDEGLTSATFDVFADKQLTDVQVGLRLNHARAADLAVHLVSPQGTRILLAENRGGLTFQGYGNGFDTNISLTYFTELTNEIESLAPIKFSTPPFTNVIGDPAIEIFADSFENSSPGEFLSNSVVSGWTVSRGRVQVHGTNNALGLAAATGTNFLELDSRSNPASILRSFETVPGMQYLLSFAYRRSPDSRPGTPHALQVYYGPPVDFRSANKFIAATAPAWIRTNIFFQASELSTMLELSALTSSGPLVDSVRVTDIPATTNTFVLPEEALDLLRGERTLGEWKLEVTDSRGGPVGAGEPAVLSWELGMKYGNPRSLAVMLTNGIPYSGTLTNNQTNYFIVDVCDSTGLAYTTLTGTNNTLALLADHSGLPTSNPETDDFRLQTNSMALDDTLGTASFVLRPGSQHPAPLRPGKRFFLAVHNLTDALADGETNTFTIQINFDRDECHGNNSIIRLVNDIPFTNSIPPITSLFDFYIFTASCNAAAVQFELTPTDGDLGMVLRKGPQPPLPSLLDFDYLRDETGNTNELIIITTNSVPVPLNPGDDWLVGVFSNTNAPVRYNIRATEISTSGAPISGTNLVTLTNSVPLNFRIDYCPQFTNYFRFSITNGAPGVRFAVSNLTDSAELFIGFNQAPNRSTFFRSNSTMQGFRIESVISPSAALPSLDGDWFLYVVDRNPGNLSFTIVAELLDAAPPTDVVYLDPRLTLRGLNEICLAWDSISNLEYQVEGKIAIEDPNWVALSPREAAAGSESSYCVTLPPFYHFFRIVQYPTALPPPPPIGGFLDPELTFFNETTLCLKWAQIPGTNYVVQAKAAIEDPEWKPISDILTASLAPTDYCISLPSPFHFFRIAVVGGTKPPPPPPPPPVASRFIDPRLVPSETTLCLQWPSAVGTNYVVQAKQNIDASSWTNLSSVIKATARLTEFCVDLPTSFQFFQIAVVGGGNQPPVEPPPVVSGFIDPGLVPTETTLCLNWSSVVGTNYVVQAKEAIDAVGWTNISSVITATAGNTEHCVPLPTSYRFFQIAILGGGGQPPVEPPPTGTEIIDPRVSVTQTNLCLQWDSVSGRSYRVEVKADLSEPDWVTLDSLNASGTSASYCVNLPTGFQFYRIVSESGGGNVGGGAVPSDVALGAPVVSASGFLQFSWPAVPGTAYELQWSTNVISSNAANWITLTNLMATGASVTVSDPDPVTNAVRFYRLRIP